MSASGPRRLGVAIAIALAGAAMLTVAIVALGDSDDPADAVGAGAANGGVATVEQGELTRQVSESGTLGYAARPDGTPYSVVNQAAGSYTALPSAGDVIGCGEVLYRVDAEPVVLLCGATPAYRALSVGASGPDVRVLNRNLVRLGYASEDELDADSTEFGAATAGALAELQDDLGLDPTGSLALGDAVFLPGPLRITTVSATLGTQAQPGQPTAQATATEREVLVELSAAQRSGVEAGDRAQITLPDNTATAGEVTRIGAAVSSADSGDEDADGSTGGGSESGSSEGTIPVYVSLERPRAARGFDEAPVEVLITTGRVADALSVPVTALVAEAGGGYAIEVPIDDGGSELVSVELGMFDEANGRVEVSGSELEAGQQVVVPAA